MQKFLIIATSCLISSAAFASITLSSTPQKPVVLTSDFAYQSDTGPVTVRGPWFSVQYQVTTDLLVTVVGIQEVVTAQDGSTTSYNWTLPGPIEISPGSSFKTDLQYLGSLKRQNGFVYSVTARLIGWVGSSSSPTSRLDLVSTFLTQ